MKCKLSAIAAFGAAMFISSSLGAAQKTVVSLDFEDKNHFTLEKSSESGQIGDTIWSGIVSPGTAVRSFEDKKYNQTMHLVQQEKAHGIGIRSAAAVPANCNHTISFDTYLEKGSFLSFSGRDNNSYRLLSLMLGGNAIPKVLHNGKWKGTRCAALNGWVHVEIEVCPSQEKYSIKLTYDGGKIYEEKEIGLAKSKTVSLLSFASSPPAGLFFTLDNVEMKHDLTTPLAGRTNVAEAVNTKAFVDQTEAALPYTFKGNETLLIDCELPGLENTSAVAVNGKGELKCTARGLNIGGQSVALASPEKFADNGAYFQADYDASVYQKVTLAITGKAGDTVDSVGIYTSLAGSQSSLDKKFAATVQAEFELPVYQNDTPVNLVFVNLSKAAFPVKVQLENEAAKKVIVPEQSVTLAPGRNVVSFDPAEIPDGRVFAKITEDKPGKVKGSFRRLLRKQTVKDPVPAEVTRFTGEKLYFFDDYYMEKAENVSFGQNPAETLQVSRSFMTPDAVMQHGETIYQHNGKICIGFFTTDGNMTAASKKRYLATADPADLSKWDIVPVADDFKHPVKADSAMHRNRRSSRIVSKDANGKSTYRFYDPEKDGKPDVRQIAIQYITSVNPNVFNYVPPPSVDGKALPPRTTWPIWYKEPGLGLILTAEPLLYDSYPGDFETGKEANDNFIGQYLSDDSKTLYYMRGCLLRRYEPFIIPYENFVNFGRFATLLSTTDGINYEKRYVSLPEIGDPVGTQHYGGYIFQLPQGNGLRVAYFSRYFIHEQRYGMDLNYSYDGKVWKRYSGTRLFADNGPVGSWNAGNMQLSRFATVSGDKMIHLINWASSSYHFYPGSKGMAGYKEETVESVKRRLASRKVETWPFFKQLGGWEGLTEDIRNSRINVGIIVFRHDGFASAKAENGTGKLVSRKLAAQGRLSANMKISGDGRAVIKLLDASGNAISGYEKSFAAADGVDIPVFSELPAGAFKVDIELENAEIYALNFEK